MPLAFVNALSVYVYEFMAVRRHRRSTRFSIDAVEVVSGRVSAAARQKLVREAKSLKISLSIHVRRILYRHLQIIEGEP